MEKKRLFILIILSIVLLILVGILLGDLFVPPYIVDITKNDSIAYKDKVVINVYVDNHFFKVSRSVWCSLQQGNKKDSDDWQKAENGYCSYIVEDGKYNIIIKDKYGNISDINSQSVKLNKILDINVKKDTFYMYKGMQDKINYEINAKGIVNPEISFVNLNDNIISVTEDGTIIAKEYGNAEVLIKDKSGVSTKVKVVVSKHIVQPKINFSKPYIKCKQFSNEEADEIDKALFSRVDDAGYGTRAGVVAAARFLTLELAYRVHYFYENGRLKNFSDYLKVDGEGRYYHRGLYLNESKFKDLEETFVGPAIWGCDLKNFTTWSNSRYSWVAGKLYPNGLDCSGFVTWAFINGGVDVGDIGAGPGEEEEDFTDLGKKEKLTNELINSDKVKVGDLIGLNGHIAILAGIDKNNYYIAESLNTTGGVVMTTVAKKNLVNNSIYRYVILMDSVYEAEGTYSNMW